MLIPRSARVRPAKLAPQEPCTLTGAFSVRPAMFVHLPTADRVGRHPEVLGVALPGLDGARGPYLGGDVAVPGLITLT